MPLEQARDIPAEKSAASEPTTEALHDPAKCYYDSAVNCGVCGYCKGIIQNARNGKHELTPETQRLLDESRARDREADKKRDKWCESCQEWGPNHQTKKGRHRFGPLFKTRRDALAEVLLSHGVNPGLASDIDEELRDLQW